MPDQDRGPIVVGISGGSGAIYGVRILERLREFDVESHLVITQPGLATLRYETDYTADDLKALATTVHPIRNIGATIASGSFKTRGMIVAPCSIKTLSGIAHCYGDNLLQRAADVTLKEQRRLALLVRETPLHLGHLRLLVSAAESGATIVPPLPAFYIRPQSVDDLIDHTVARVLDLFDIDVGMPRWEGQQPGSPT
ncbi:UbiX family flavin prenyltransferase [Nocardioides sp. LHD-245]|uniref:UbiX family flavin prenyltransferase n=1 Tax=Nocardioides sp. LHD-245 TaxID=3051387 RepID=UPI0027DFC84C|nr:UbiX family flavin prenyltransferase [Nocardioides sp. LHD-245]